MLNNTHLINIIITCSKSERGRREKVKRNIDIFLCNWIRSAPICRGDLLVLVTFNMIIKCLFSWLETNTFADLLNKAKFILKLESFHGNHPVDVIGQRGWC